MVLAGDIGGTKTRLGFFAVTKKSFRLLSEKTFLNRDYSQLENILEDFTRGQNNISSACFGVAGPVTGEIIQTKNLPWVIKTKSLQNKLCVKSLEIINDLVANAYGIPVLNKKDFVNLNRGKTFKGNRALISAGTGLGEAVLFWNGKCHIPSPSEGGHAEFGPRNSLEIELLKYLDDKFNRVSYERLLSGEGIIHIYKFLRDYKRLAIEPEWLSINLKREDPAMIISETARMKKNRLCITAMDMFASIYGAAAGNLALQAMALGGVYIGGGIAPRIIWKLKDGTFMNAFKKKGRLSNIVARIPVNVIMNDRAALLGAASYAVSLLKNKQPLNE
ncbi:MAG: glucokinase [Nitrospirae bacterium RBG_13_39_12]|nr:MAG: glucokinase [Nitrospirae bacterium RBG_13_39_12]